MEGVGGVIRDCGKKLGYEVLKEKQIEAVSSFIEGNDVFVSLPTGYGKSLIYAILPFLFDTLKGELHSNFFTLPQCP